MRLNVQNCQIPYYTSMAIKDGMYVHANVTFGVNWEFKQRLWTVRGFMGGGILMLIF